MSTWEKYSQIFYPYTTSLFFMLTKNIVIHLYWSVDSFKRIYRVNQYFAVRELIFEFPLFYVRITIQGFDTFPMLSICLLYRWYCIKKLQSLHKKKTISRYKTTYNESLDTRRGLTTKDPASKRIQDRSQAHLWNFEESLLKWIFMYPVINIHERILNLQGNGSLIATLQRPLNPFHIVY